jgi:hypothetical protein
MAHVPTQTSIAPVSQGRRFEYSLMDLGLLPILYSIIYSKHKIVKSRRETVFSIPEDVDADPFECEKPVFTAPRASSAKERTKCSPRVLTSLEHSLTLTHIQHPAMLVNTGNRKPVAYAEFVKPCNAQQPQSAH